MAELVLSLFELAEAEGRLLRANVERTGAGCLLAAVGIIFIGTALAFLVAALYSVIREYVPAPVTFVILAASCLFTGFILILIAKPRKRKKSKNAKTTGSHLS